ncbi:hypothetical protein OJAV_G00211460 [Oryzias javanicus]|uniref:Uncharacterized protein n=1 Tax=Oryzias javanicus TaxID=123683 RepID=A0A437C2U3_ORYJA|nr:hypothetical protein OJAV_G00211460 [Oryzias javanicus]
MFTSRSAPNDRLLSVIHPRLPAGGGVNGIGGEALPRHADVDTSIRGRERKTRNCLLLSGGIQGDILIQIDVI